ncbi:hypothetical protein [Sphingomonas sp. LHG3406-1]|uniref:hypothetical protein n=1 Tax=Sphingomonas sp. LHG3406-1 TaxID=2804617 RepID=UPI00261D937C|nr:hypothetical protein [Sphingomonas sp. LHG3406-1]
MWRSLIVVAALALSACGDRLPDYCYKITVTVDTPQGEKSYSAVRQVEMIERSTIQDTTGVRIDRKVTGEAVILDLPSGPAFALMAMLSDGQSLGEDHARKVAEVALLPHISPTTHEAWKKSSFKGSDPIGTDVDAFREMAEVEGPRDLPRSRPAPGSYTGKVQQLWPIFVRFQDVRDPQSIYRVQPEEIGVKRISIEITDEEVTSRIEQTLPWLPALLESGGVIDGNRFRPGNDVKSTTGAGSFLQRD